MIKKPEVISSEEVYNGWYRARKDMLKVDGLDGLYPYDVITPGDGVGVLAFLDEDTLLLARQGRPPLDKGLLELIQGGMNKGETPLECGKRELLEETGYNAKFEYFINNNNPLPCLLDMRTYAVIATDLVKVQEPIKDPLEDMELVEMPFDQVLEDILNDKHGDAIIKIAVMTYQLKYRQ
jgi:ADP-ribose pyrophosphatase|tara:strand:- start:221 stop:760 length:540 start_codon:yes stop_codon:yes gene_type:complete